MPRRSSLFPITRRDASMRDRASELRDLVGKDRRTPGGLAVDGAQAVLGALLAGLLVGRLNHWNIPNTPIPVGLAAGGALSVLAFHPRTSGAGRLLSNLGIGAAASWGTMIGAGWGRQMRAAAGEEITPITAGRAVLPGASRAPRALGHRPKRLSEAELAALMREPRT